MINTKFVYNDSYEDCTHRLSANSKAFCEKYPIGNEWYEFTPVFNYDTLGVVTKNNGEMLTSDISFIEHLRLIYTYNYKNLKKKWDEIVDKTPKEYKGLKVIAVDFPSENEIKKEIFEYFSKKYTKTIEIIDNGEFFTAFRAPKTQTFPFETEIPGVDNFESFEKFIKNFYGLNNYSLIEPEKSENSPIEFWKAKKYNYLPYIKELDGLTFVNNDFLKKVQKKENEKWFNAAKEKLEKILNAKDIGELNWNDKPHYIEKIIKDYQFNELNDLYEKTVKHYKELIYNYNTNNYIKDNLSTLKNTKLYDEFIDEVESQKPKDYNEGIKWIEDNEPYDDENFVKYIKDNYSSDEIKKTVNTQKEKENNNQVVNDGGSRPRPK